MAEVLAFTTPTATVRPRRERTSGGTGAVFWWSN